MLSCAVSGVVISVLPETPNFYHNTVCITCICELRARMRHHNIHPVKWSSEKLSNATSNLWVDH